MEPTHIINPIRDSGIIPTVETDTFGSYVTADTIHQGFPSLYSGTFETESAAVSEWNGMFSKAPKMYGADGGLV